jgi:hypothetical protein
MFAQIVFALHQSQESVKVAEICCKMGLSEKRLKHSFEGEVNVLLQVIPT